MEEHNDIQEHDNMTLTKLAEHLKVDLWKVMEIARWTSARPKPKGDEMTPDIRGILERQVLPRLKHQGMTPADFYGIHREHNELFIKELATQIDLAYKKHIEKNYVTIKFHESHLKEQKEGWKSGRG